MNDKLGLKEVEQKVFQTTFQDGLWDIYLGLLLIIFGLSPLLEYLGFGFSENWILILSAPVVITFWAAKKFISTPRIGSVKFAPSRKAKLKNVQIIIASWLIVGIIFFILTVTNKFSSSGINGFNAPLIAWVVLCLFGFSLGAYYLNFNRLYLYGIFYAIPFPFLMQKHNLLLRNIGYITFFTFGGIMVLIGSILFIHFFRNYSLLEEEQILKRKIR